MVIKRMSDIVGTYNTINHSYPIYYENGILVIHPMEAKKRPAVSAGKNIPSVALTHEALNLIRNQNI